MGNYCNFSQPKSENPEVSKSSQDTVVLISATKEEPPRPKSIRHETTLETIKNIHEEKSLEIVELERAAQADEKIILLPHQHTLFCERKQRVCGAVGQLQEYEVLKFVHKHRTHPHSYVWVRLNNRNVSSEPLTEGNYVVISDTENAAQYSLTKEDVGHYITVLFTEDAEPADSSSNTTDATDKQETEDGQSQERHLSARPVSTALSLSSPLAVGPITPGPPRLLDFVLTGTMEVGTRVTAENTYIGGFEGHSEYWWMRITADGKREQITEPVAVADIGTEEDSRHYLLTSEDVGCTLKAKCRPIRSDGAKGEIFTSKSSGTVIPRGEAPEVTESESPEEENKSEVVDQHAGEVTSVGDVVVDVVVDTNVDIANSSADEIVAEIIADGGADIKADNSSESNADGVASVATFVPPASVDNTDVNAEDNDH